MNNIFVVPFSGGCFSGKTTAMIAVQKELEERGFNCTILEEPIRKIKLSSIDDIRKDPKAYLDIQLAITLPRLASELRLRETHFNEIILIDRATADSLFYPLFYLDKSSLTDQQLVNLQFLLSSITKAAKTMYSNIYDLVFFFEPLNIVCTDTKFRPNNIEILKHIESNMIYTLMQSFTDEFITWNMQKNNTIELVNVILNFIPNHEIYKSKTRKKS